MIQNEKLIQDVMRIYELNLYETKLWLALLSRGISTAGELSTISGVPRSRTYDVLESLAKKALISVKRDVRPVKYMAIDPVESLKQVRVNYDKEMEEKSNIIDKLREHDVLMSLKDFHREGSKMVEKHERAGILQSRRGISHQIDSLIRGAKKTLEIIATAEEATYLAEHHYKQLKEASDRGVKIKLAGPFKKGDGFVKKLSEVGKVKPVKKVSARIVLKDRDEVVFSLFTNKDVHDLYDTAVWVHSPYFSTAMSELFDHVWSAK